MKCSFEFVMLFYDLFGISDIFSESQPLTSLNPVVLVACLRFSARKHGSDAVNASPLGPQRGRQHGRPGAASGGGGRVHCSPL